VMSRMEGIDEEIGGFEQVKPVLDQGLDADQIQLLVESGELDEIGLGQLEQRGGGAEAVLLQMDKSAGELDEALVKIAVDALAIRQPQVFQDVVRLVELLFVEEHKVSGIAGIHARARKLGGQFGHALTLFAHGRSLSVLTGKTNNLKKDALRRTVGLKGEFL